MPHSPEEKKRAITRLRRIRGQAEALERAIEADCECGPLLQQIVAMRGATNGLIAEVLEGHLRVTFGRGDDPAKRGIDVDGEIDGVMRIFRTYLK
ncbi:metal-sensing transcriptional repressor [Mesorhizobium australicum]|jgi:DNA-binding FrmR family transcriptional regulator|uniref:DNA-binding transcriptional regulator, FrmR family n=1 Tax=Mesorhizobium australicum TaxID=536018 RepID=A0A1X7MQ69_9HYPH|nr:metal-sensing transcriptional repressor [Mesorhizobium australicum]SMH26825.1 DNA-binding transcriptional regulator, FrmR family [Mesorhizobium australicum]